MPIPNAVARFNRVATNRVLRPFTARLPGFAVVRHNGRTSGRPYRTPVGLFARPDGYVIALTYGPDRDWVKNIVAAGGCELEIRGRTVAATAPRVVHDPARTGMPPGVKQALTLLGVTDFLHLSRP
ncbi:nitroreductase family deazaflavin-dependent oxidoreductase [Actinomadura parmotrematis]|uniref:Nitroreductase family deazaflavin-dependent oxidoreductase n=1 Tax=Actinomadura parmotrematis TaxID=2864039 RepID=A0ABS7G6W8_9ACTN|nr:nitroreductase family deazaflavin-dependent oxidoreductase [Actinomadura parmotrematis]MBW8487557.1 nitroreductase family deazaflavin-dependent oxidoreductase [Actinomadura parmotrematis]